MKKKWGILGAGWIADKFVSDFSAVNNGEVVAVAARSLERARKFAAQYNIPKAYGSYNDLVNDENIDIIYVATTHNFHFEHSKLCLENNKAVVCEKPATVNTLEFDEISRIAQSKKLFYMEAMWTPFLPAVKKAQEWVNTGKIGEIKAIQANFGFSADPESRDRLFNPTLAGGALLDIGIYPLTIIEMFAQSEIIDKTIDYSMTKTGVDETLAIQLKYKNGIKAQLSTSINCQLLNDAIICGSKGKIQIKDFWMSKKATLTTDITNEEFVDSTTTMGYNHETVAVNDDLINQQIENAILPQKRTRKMLLLMDSIRKDIGFKYPFEK